jgi:hypothetical protein
LLKPILVMNSESRPDLRQAGCRLSRGPLL